MSSPINTPSGGGAQSGLGEKFSPDLFTGTGNFTVPIALPPGRNGFQPEISLGYSTGSGNSAFGLGWGMGIPGVSRKTAKGVPKYDSQKDTFILSGAEDLIPVSHVDTGMFPEVSEQVAGVFTGVTQYRPRTEGLFARIYHYLDNENDYWKVMSKDGLISWYGTPETKGNDPAVVTDPDNTNKVFSWKLTRTEDTFGNHILYEYERDQIRDDAYHHWDQNYLKTIKYVDYDDNGTTKYLVKVEFIYENRPDPFSSYKCGFEERTVKRCKEVKIYTNPTAGEILTRTYHFQYSDERLPVEEQPHNGVSLLCRVEVEGHDGAESEFLPPLDFRYTHFKPKDQKFRRLEGDSMPLASLANPGFEMIDLFGNGLPDIVEINGVIRYWRNLGDGRFDMPRLMKDAPAGITLGDPNVQLIDANGDGRTDLLVNSDKLAGYFSTKFNASWDSKSFRKYKQGPSFNLADPEVKLVDLDGDGVTDALRSGSSFECFFNDKNDGWVETRRVPRKQLSHFPNVNFSDPRVKWADMTGDGMQDIVVVHSGNITYWPSMGYGNFGKPVTMKNSPRFPHNFDPARVQLGDIDGDGQADIIYIDAEKVTFWINKSGNGWSEPFEITGTPFVTNINGIRIADVLGSGISGVLYSFDAVTNTQRHRWYFLDLTGGIKPYLLHEMDNKMGALTRTHYLPSTRYYLADQYGMDPFAESVIANGVKQSPPRFYKNRKPWKTTLPFPVHVVSRVEVIDKLSLGKLTTEYIYHHGYWDGGEREFRGFGRVDQRDTETFERYNSSGLHNATPLSEGVAGGISPPTGGDTEGVFSKVNIEHYTPPTETRNWFHLGPIGDEFGDWMETDFSDEYWQEDKSVLQRDKATIDLIKSLPRRAKRDAYRAWRGSLLRTELYALDEYDSETQTYKPGANGRPYTITESQYGLRLEAAPAGWQPAGGTPLLGGAGGGSSSASDGEWGDVLSIPKETSGFIFFSFATASRTTQWERGDDPMTQFSFTADFDKYGQPLKRLAAALPRGIKPPYDVGTTNVPAEDGGGKILSTFSTTSYIHKDDEDLYIVNRVCRTIGYEVIQQNNESAFALQERVLQAALPVAADTTQFKIIGCTFNYYDGDEFDGLDYGELGDHGALVRSETLILTQEIIDAAYDNVPECFKTTPDSPDWSTGNGYPDGFEGALQNGDDRLGYVEHKNTDDANYPTGWYSTGSRTKYDFQDGIENPKGLVVETRDVFDNSATIEYDNYNLLPVSAKQWLDEPDFLETIAEYDYRVLQAKKITDPNGNRSVFGFSPLGLLKQSGLIGKYTVGTGNPTEGDLINETATTINYKPSVLMEYDFFAFLNYGDPVWVKTIQREKHVTQDADSPEIIKVEYTDGFGRLLQTRTQAEDVIFGDQTFGNSGLPEDQSATNQPAVGIQRAATDPLNVVVSGWKVYNNKGKVVEQYEPFFEKGFDYQPPFDGATLHASLAGGVKIRMFYDPRGQVVRTINPDGSEQRVLFGIPEQLGSLPPTTYSTENLTPTPWESYTYDANDLAPLTHPTGSGVPAGHHYTPKSIKLDALGRTIKTIDRLGQNAADEVVMRYKLDIRGNLIEVKDALATPRTVFTHVYDLKPKTGKDDPGANVLYTVHVDAGWKAVLFDATGKPVVLRDVKGSEILNAYDSLNRPIRVWAIDNTGESFKQRQYLRYGDSAGLTDPEDQNLKGKLYRHYDEAGMVEMTEYDFKGNVLEKKRQTIKDSEILSVFSGGPPFQCYRVQWDPGGQNFDTYAASLLDTTNTHQISTEYDALNRATQITYPEDYNGDQKVVIPTYNRAGALQKVMVDNDPYVEHIAYNAKGQRLLIALNAVMTRYTYDSATFRLKRIRSETYTHTPGEWEFESAGNVKQDTAYDYDLAGNIVATAESRTGCGIGGDNSLEREFDYDPLYRLLRATGRENAPPVTPIWDDRYRSNDHTLTTGYTQLYKYDKMGNILKLQHIGNSGFTRVFNPDTFGDPPPDYGNSNLLNEVKINGTTYNFQYDDSGNLKQENADRFYEWDYANRMRCFYIDDGMTITKYAHYLYNAQGNRVKKIVRTSSGDYDSITYVDGIFEYRTDGTDEQNIAHIMDDKSRIAMIRTGDDFGENKPAIKYIIEDHLGSSVFELEYDGTNIEQEEYYPFGETSYASYQKKRYKYCGKERDEESGLYYYGARCYATWICRFVSIDPEATKTLEFSGFSYANNNPLNYKDPDGKQTVNADDKEPSNNNVELKYEWATATEDTTSDIELATGNYTITGWTEGRTDLSEKHVDLIYESMNYDLPEDVEEYSDLKAVRAKVDSDYLIKFKDQWVAGYKKIIKEIAEKENIPVELLAMTAWTEVGGSPPSEDWAAYYGRKAGLDDTPPEKTSFGNIQMQIRTAAELLGYDPNNLTDNQTGMIIKSLLDNIQNIMLAAKYLKYLITVDWGGQDPKTLTKEQVMLTALRYSRGPSAYLDTLREALKNEPYKSKSYDKMKKLFQ